jgi:hypothetical protein
MSRQPGDLSLLRSVALRHTLAGALPLAPRLWLPAGIIGAARTAHEDLDECSMSRRRPPCVLRPRPPRPLAPGRLWPTSRRPLAPGRLRPTSPRPQPQAASGPRRPGPGPSRPPGPGPRPPGPGPRPPGLAPGRLRPTSPRSRGPHRRPPAPAPGVLGARTAAGPGSRRPRGPRRPPAPRRPRARLRDWPHRPEGRCVGAATRPRGHAGPARDTAARRLPLDTVTRSTACLEAASRHAGRVGRLRQRRPACEPPHCCLPALGSGIHEGGGPVGPPPGLN